MVKGAKGKPTPVSNHIVRDALKWRVKDLEMTALLHEVVSDAAAAAAAVPGCCAWLLCLAAVFGWTSQKQVVPALCVGHMPTAHVSNQGHCVGLAMH